MYDPAGPQLPQETKKVIDVKPKSEITVKSDHVPLQDSVQVQITSVPETSNNDASTKIQEEVDLMNFDDDCLNLDFSNNNRVNGTIKEMVYNVQHVPMIDQLLCDLNFGRDLLTTKDESKGKKINVQNNTSKAPEQEMPKKKIPVKDDVKDNGEIRTRNKPNDVFAFRVPPVLSSVSATKRTSPSNPSYVEPANRTQLTVAPNTYATNITQTAGTFRIKPVKEIQPTFTPRTHITKTKTDKILPAMEMTCQKQIDKPMRRKIYSFVELLVYQFSPITKELYNDVNGRFSHYAVDYGLLNRTDRPRRPGVLRGTICQQSNGWKGQGDRPMNCKSDRFVTSPIRKHFESPLELSFLKECVVAQNRWTALLHERELRTSCIKEIKDCKGMKWVNAHMRLTDKHSESCLAFHVTSDQWNKTNYRGKSVRFEEKDGITNFEDCKD